MTKHQIRRKQVFKLANTLKDENPAWSIDKCFNVAKAQFQTKSTNRKPRQE